MSRARSLSPAESARVCTAVRAMVEEYGSQEAVARQLQMADGSPVSQGSVSIAQRGLPVGVAFARAVALKLGVTFEELVSGTKGTADGAQFYKDLPGWAEAAEEVVAEELLPRYVVTAAGETVVSFPVKRVDAGLVYDQGMLWIKHAPLEIRKAAEKADILAARVERQARDDARYAELAHSDDLARGSMVADVTTAATRAAGQRG